MSTRQLGWTLTPKRCALFVLWTTLARGRLLWADLFHLLVIQVFIDVSLQDPQWSGVSAMNPVNLLEMSVDANLTPSVT